MRHRGTYYNSQNTFQHRIAARSIFAHNASMRTSSASDVLGSTTIGSRPSGNGNAVDAVSAPH
jgi:hypothetical protein